DLATECSCPDYSNPCKHIAAVYYLLGEEFDRDPFLLFKLRGLSREELLGRLGERAPHVLEDATAEPATPPEPLVNDPARFWNGGDVPDNLLGEVQLPPVSAALPKRLGNFPFWRGAEHFLDAVEPIYRQAAPEGFKAFQIGRASWR